VQSQAQVVTIFDWDDTLLCTTHLEMVQRQYGAIPVHVRDQLTQLESVVHQILEQASRLTSLGQTDHVRR